MKNCHIFLISLLLITHNSCKSKKDLLAEIPYLIEPQKKVKNRLLLVKWENISDQNNIIKLKGNIRLNLKSEGTFSLVDNELVKIGYHAFDILNCKIKSQSDNQLNIQNNFTKDIPFLYDKDSQILYLNFDKSIQNNWNFINDLSIPLKIVASGFLRFDSEGFLSYVDNYSNLNVSETSNESLLKLIEGCFDTTESKFFLSDGISRNIVNFIDSFNIFSKSPKKTSSQIEYRYNGKSFPTRQAVDDYIRTMSFRKPKVTYRYDGQVFSNKQAVDSYVNSYRVKKQKVEPVSYYTVDNLRFKTKDEVLSYLNRKKTTTVKTSSVQKVYPNRADIGSDISLSGKLFIKKVDTMSGELVPEKASKLGQVHDLIYQRSPTYRRYVEESVRNRTLEQISTKEYKNAKVDGIIVKKPVTDASDGFAHYVPNKKLVRVNVGNRSEQSIIEDLAFEITNAYQYKRINNIYDRAKNNLGSFEQYAKDPVKIAEVENIINKMNNNIGSYRVRDLKTGESTKAFINIDQSDYPAFMFAREIEKIEYDGVSKLLPEILGDLGIKNSKKWGNFDEYLGAQYLHKHTVNQMNIYKSYYSN